MPNLARILKKPQGLSAKSWRQTLEKLMGPGGERVYQCLADAIEGRAWQPVWRDSAGVEHVGEPVVPSWADRIAAAKYVADRMHGKAVDQTEAERLNSDARDQAAARALTDEELDRRLRLLDPGPEVDAQTEDLEKSKA